MDDWKNVQVVIIVHDGGDSTSLYLRGNHAVRHIPVFDPHDSGLAVHNAEKQPVLRDKAHFRQCIVHSNENHAGMGEIGIIEITPFVVLPTFHSFVVRLDKAQSAALECHIAKLRLHVSDNHSHEIIRDKMDGRDRFRECENRLLALAGVADQAFHVGGIEHAILGGEMLISSINENFLEVGTRKGADLRDRRRQREGFILLPQRVKNQFAHVLCIEHAVL